NLRVSGTGFSDEVVNNILAPVAGAVRVEVPPLIPETVTIIGTVLNPYTQVNAVIDLVGLEGGITGGSPVCITNGEQTAGTFSIDGVPTNTKDQLTVVVKTYTFDETCKITITSSSSNAFTAVNNGSGVYRVAFAE
ncbi:hypothetical protein MJH12_14875, partial [bacterium]|nr:hypothetical protein [bacterium]